VTDRLTFTKEDNMKFEDANCDHPCGMEPIGCSDCPETIGFDPTFDDFEEFNREEFRDYVDD
jgi:hypothetical protein